MNWKNKILILLVGLLLFGGAFFASDASRAQQVPTKQTTTPTPDQVENDDEPIKIDTEVVNVLFTAQDKNRRLLTELKKEDVRLVEDGQTQEITAFGRQVDLPLSLAILIDTSQSQERTLPDEKSAAKSFIEAVVRPVKDEVAVVTFTGEATLEQGMTNSVTRLQRAVDRVKFVPPSGSIGVGVYTGTPPLSGGNQQVAASTALWDAIWITADEILGPAPEKTRRAIILLTDGVNTFGKKKLDEAVQAALKSEAVIYSIGIGDNFYGGVDQPSLRKISERTGGRAFFPQDEAELRKAFMQIQIEMRSQYLIAYEPTNQKRDGSYRKIEIQLANPELTKQKVTLTHRQGYFARTESKK
jgi:Ca-activated chloride channel family protein